MFNKVEINKYEKGLYYYKGEYRLLSEGVHNLPFMLNKDQLVRLSLETPLIRTKNIDLIIKSGVFDGEADIVDIKDNERVLVWKDNRFYTIFEPGIYAIWKRPYEIRMETIEVESPEFRNTEINTILKSEGVDQLLDEVSVEHGFEGLLFLNSEFIKKYPPGRYFFWTNCGKIKFIRYDLREKVIDISGQDIMTSDKVTLRINTILNYKVIDTLKVSEATEDITSLLYREAQLALRSIIGTKDLESILKEKDIVTTELEKNIRKKGESRGVKLLSFGIKDIVLPGDMKDLLNRVTEAKKIAEANLISRREETAAIRSQLNSAKIMENNPTLMKLKELEVIEKALKDAKLNFVLSEKGIKEAVLNLL